jgi:hypothetical protein
MLHTALCYNIYQVDDIESKKNILGIAEAILKIKE